MDRGEGDRRATQNPCASIGWKATCREGNAGSDLASDYWIKNVAPSPMRLTRPMQTNAQNGEPLHLYCESTSSQSQIYGPRVPTWQQIEASGEHSSTLDDEPVVRVIDAEAMPTISRTIPGRPSRPRRGRWIWRSAMGNPEAYSTGRMSGPRRCEGSAGNAFRPNTLREVWRISAPGQMECGAGALAVSL